MHINLSAGRFFPDEDDKFMERVRAAVEEEERQAAAAADTQAAVVAIASAAGASKATGQTLTAVPITESGESLEDQLKKSDRNLPKVLEKDATDSNVRDTTTRAVFALFSYISHDVQHTIVFEDGCCLSCSSIVFRLF